MWESSKRSIYVLTIWQERPASPDEPAVWRCSLEEARTGEKHAFRSLEELVAFFSTPDGGPGPDRGE